MNERRFTPAPAARVRLEERAENESPAIVGYAAVFFNPSDPGTEFELWDGAVERIMPGAFDRAVREDDVMALFNHEIGAVLGRNSAGTMTLEVDSRGLLYRITPPDTKTAEDVVALLRRGDVDGSSFAFIITDATWDVENEVDVREIKGVRLFDVGPVVYAAYPSTTAGVRGERGRGEITEARDSHTAWKRGTSLAAAEKQVAVTRGRARRLALIDRP